MTPMPALLVLVAAALLGAGCGHTHAPLPTVATVDPERYAGRWFEIARLPNRFQAQCASDTRARYTREGDHLTVVNECRTGDGRLTRAQGIAKLVADSGNARLRVSFFRPFYGDYWVLALDPDYRWALVGEPRRRYAWILARSPRLDDATREALLSRAAELGFDRGGFLDTPHTQR